MQDDSLLQFSEDHSSIAEISGHHILRGVYGSAWGIRCVPLKLASAHYIHFGTTTCLVIKAHHVDDLVRILKKQFNSELNNAPDFTITGISSFLITYWIIMVSTTKN